MDTARTRIPAYLALAVGALSLYCYLPALNGFFSSDDWLLVYYYGRIPPSRFWEFFSPEVIWFYRPLQAFQFGLFHHLFGLNELPYNLSLLALHLVVCVLAHLLVRELGGGPELAWGTTGLFMAQWIYVDILLWKVNLNTLYWAVLTLAACCSIGRYLKGGGRRWLWTTYALCALNFLAKESAANAPFLLLLVWLCLRARRQDFHPRRWGALAISAARPLWPVVLMTAGYVLFHALCVRDVYTLLRPDYRFVPPLTGLYQALFIYNHTLLSFYPDPLFLKLAPDLQAAVVGLVRTAVVLPFLLVLYGWRARDRLLLFGTAWVLLADVPMVFLTNYHQARFYYVPAVGACLVLARLFERAWQAAAGQRPAVGSALRIALCAFAAYCVAVNLTVLVVMVEQDHAASELGRAAFRLLQARRSDIPRGALVVFRRAPQALFNNGIGTREMVRLALEDPTADGIEDTGPVDPERLAGRGPDAPVYALNLGRTPLRLERLSSPAGTGPG